MQRIAADRLVESVGHVGALSRHTIGEIGLAAGHLDLAPGEYPFPEGDSATDTCTAIDSPRRLDHRGPGETIGETAIWDDSERRSSARARNGSIAQTADHYQLADKPCSASAWLRYATAGSVYDSESTLVGRRLRGQNAKTRFGISL